MINLSVKKLTACLFLISSAVHAQGLQSSLGDLLKNSSRVSTARSDELAASERASESFRRAWTPQFDVTVEGGQQKFASPSAPNSTYEQANRSTARVTQLVYDFGRSNSQISELETLAKQSVATGLASSESLLLEAISAHWGVVRSKQVMDYSRLSENSVRNQTKLESSMVELGKGYESNVLQAKVQLATAEARRIRAEGALQIAQARMSAVFGGVASKVQYDEVVMPLQKMLPSSLEEAHAIALSSNKQIQIGTYRSEALRQRIDGIRAREFLPSLRLIGEAGRREGVDGLAGYVNDRKVLLQLQYNLNGGLAGQSAVDAAVKDMQASQSREDDTRQLVLEQVSIAWRNLLVARSNRNILSNQVNIATKFLEMASAERQLGRRSLLDILTAEMSLITAQSDLATTDSEMAIAGVTLLQAIGRLGLDSLVVTKLAAKS
jgi:outer membrane protein TolC